MRRLTALPLALVLALGACASQPEPAEPSPSSSQASSAPAELRPAKEDPALAVEVTGAADAKPEVTFANPFAVTETVRKVVTEGGGEGIAMGESVDVDFTLYNGRDGKEVVTSYGQAPATWPMNEEFLRGVVNGLVGTSVGDRVAIAVAPAEGFGANATQVSPELTDKDTVVFVVDVRAARTPLTQAQGEPVTPPPGLPTVEVDADGKPTGITIPEDAKTPPAETVVQPLIKGTGPVVQTGQTISVHYTGVRLEDGEQFDSSWEKGEPAEFPIGVQQVIVGWDEGLVGQTVGSRVLLVIPQAKAYPDANAENGRPTGALVFVVDILDAK